MIYTVHPTRAISETLDNETIIINLDTGAYYSMNETGSIAWEYLRTGSTPDAITEAFMHRYAGSSTEMAESIRTLIAELVAEGLVQETSTEGPQPALPTPTEQQPFTAPRINRYDDMQEMLLADPVHDVDQAGWPILKTDAS